MKGKSITFRPKKEMRERLDALAEATERPITFFIDKAIEACLPELEKRYGVENKTYPPHKGERIVVEEKAGPSSESKKADRELLDIVEKHYPSPKPSRRK